MDHQTLATIWFGLLGVLLIGYAILDGFDLGVGIMHLIVPKSDTERRISINSIGPLWDGNEVWLITFGGALFAAFPEAYASIFSGFYTAFFLLLFALILRAVSMEFRGKMQAEHLGPPLLPGVVPGHAALRRGGGQRHDRPAAGRAGELHGNALHPAEPLLAGGGRVRRLALRDARDRLPAPEVGGRAA